MTRCPPRVQCRGVVPAVSHIMLHSDTLAQEFNEILNGVEIFAPFQPLDPAVTFYAPLRTTVRDLRLNQDDFQRNSDAWYKDGSGIYRNVGINRARFEEGRLLMEPARTNKCENYNFSPDPALFNIDVSGAAIISRVLDPDSIRQMGLQELGNNYIFNVDNSASGSPSFAGAAGVTGNLNDHAISGWCRQTAGANPSYMRLSNGNLFVEIPRDGNWHFLKNHGAITSATVRWQINCGANCIVDFIGNQLEESPVVTSPIVTEGTAGQRAVDLLTYVSANNYVNFAQGMIFVTMQARADLDDLGDDYTTGIATLNDQTNRFFHMRRPPSGNLSFRLSDGTNLATSPAVTHSQGDLLYAAGRWSGAEMQVGFRRNNDPWLWNPVQPYDGAWPSNNLMTIARSAVHPWQYGELFIYDEDRGTAWIEANYP